MSPRIFLKNRYSEIDSEVLTATEHSKCCMAMRAWTSICAWWDVCKLCMLYANYVHTKQTKFCNRRSLSVHFTCRLDSLKT